MYIAQNRGEREYVMNGQEHGVATSHTKLVDSLSALPHKILQHYHLGYLPQIILHELGHDHCFDLKRAIYLVNNPDFNHLVGIAGFCCKECVLHKKDLWSDPQAFPADMKDATFHNEIKKFVGSSLNDPKELMALGLELGLTNPQVFTWHMKHGNHGILIFEQDHDIAPWKQSLLHNAAALLSLCGF